MLDNGSPSKRSKFSISSLVIGQMQASVAGLVTKRTKISEYCNHRGPGQVFSFVLVDDVAEIRVSVFGKDLRSTWDVCMDNVVVRVDSGVIKVADPKYNKTDNRQEMTLSVENRGSIFPSNEIVRPRAVQYDFKKIVDLTSVGMNAMVDVRGVIAAVQPPEEVVTNAGKRLDVAKLTLVDQSGFSVSCTLWASSATQVNTWAPGDVLAIRRARTQKYANSLILGCSKAEVQHGPDDSNARDLAQWYQDATLNGIQFQPLLVTHNRIAPSCDAGRDDDIIIDHPEQFYALYMNLQRVRLRFGTKELTFLRVVNESRTQESSPPPSSTPIAYRSQTGAESRE